MRNARSIERALTDFSEAARDRSAFVWRVALSIRPEGAAAAGPRPARTPPRRPSGFEGALLWAPLERVSACAAKGCGHCAGAMALAFGV